VVAAELIFQFGFEHSEVTIALDAAKILLGGLAFSPDGKTLASGSSDMTIILCVVATGQSQDAPLTGHMNDIYSVAFSPNGKTLASGGGDQTVIMWDVPTRQPQA
jgi:WD40 repeat protein